MPSESSKEIQLEIAHVLFIDIVGYSKLLINDQRAAIDELNQAVRASGQFQNAECAARLIKIPTGDGMALVFYKSPEEPVKCALEISRAVKKHPNLQLRMGVHSGPVGGVIDVNGQANLAGAGLNTARRVMDCADAGHILLSKRVADDLREYGQWRPLLHDLGECEVKHGMRTSIVNLHAEEVGNPQLPKKFQALKHTARMRWTVTIGTLLALAVIVAGIAMFFRYRAPSILLAPEKSIAVLPFENLSTDNANAYFADGIQDEILTRLSNIADLKVISRTSTQQYKGVREDLPEIARQLGVAHVLKGSVQKIGDAVRVNVQLIKAANDSHLWAETFDRKLIDIFSVESEVAKAIADQLRVKLTGQEEQVLAAKATNNPEAYDAYLRGLSYSLRTANTSSNALGAQKYLRQAVRLDPNFALSWALLSWVDARGYITAVLEPTVALRDEAQQAAEKALTLQPNLGEALLAKGHYHYACLRDYDTAVRYFEQARQRLPNNSRIPESLAYLTRRQGQWDRSESYFNEAERLDPRNVDLLSQHALSYCFLRRFPDAMGKFERVLNITPDDLSTVMYEAGIAQARGDLTRASALLAPLHPNLQDNQTLETQVYQAILERRPAQFISQLKEILAKPDLELGYSKGELRFWLGWAQEVGGDHASAQESWQQARKELESFLTEQPENYILIDDLALTNAGLNDKAAAFSLIERAMTVVPIEKDALDGFVPIEILARAAALMGESDRAITALQKVLPTPYEGALASNMPLTPALLRLDPMFDSLRNDPRFQKLAAASAPK